MTPLPTFEIFAGIPDRDAVWVCAVQGLANAKEQMDRMAAEKPGPYYIFLSTTREIVARTEGRVAPQHSFRRHPQLQAALEIVRRIGYNVGQIVEVDGEPHVIVDGKPLSDEGVFQLVEDYNKKRA